MQVHESQIDPAANPGATYMIESWYIAREDINIENSMATINGTPHYREQPVVAQQPERLQARSRGQPLGRARPHRPANTLNSLIANSEGHAHVAVKAIDNGNGTWPTSTRSRTSTSRVPSCRRPTTVPIRASSATRASIRSRCRSRPVRRSARRRSTTARSMAPAVDGRDRIEPRDVDGTASTNTLDWGSMYTFSLTVNAAPAAAVHPQIGPAAMVRSRCTSRRTACPRRTGPSRSFRPRRSSPERAFAGNGEGVFRFAKSAATRGGLFFGRLLRRREKQRVLGRTRQERRRLAGRPIGMARAVVRRQRMTALSAGELK